MSDVLLEGRIRGISGVTSCSVGPSSVVVVAGRGVDAADLERRLMATADLDGRELRVLGGVRMASGRRSSGAAAELGRVALVAGAAAGLVGLLVGPSSAHLIGSVVAPASPLSTTNALNGEARSVRAVAHRSSGQEAVRSAVSAAPRVASSPVLLVAEPAVRRRPATVRPPAPAAALTARAAASVAPDVATVVPPEVPATPGVAVVRQTKVKGKAVTQTVAASRTSSTTTMFGISSVRTGVQKNKADKVDHKRHDKPERVDKQAKADKAKSSGKD